MFCLFLIRDFKKIFVCMSVIFWNSFATSFYNSVTARALHMLAHWYCPPSVATKTRDILTMVAVHD
tara:strand:- start:1877 stop:2074 length:198 start_codon:yes stop_codon:yes gene_type:complete